MRNLLLGVCSDIADENLYMSFEQATAVLRNELNYPEDRAMLFVQIFDRNRDGQLSTDEFMQFRKTVEQTSVKTMSKTKLT